MMILAHIFGLPFEELLNPTTGVLAASATAFLLSAITSRLPRQNA